MDIGATGADRASGTEVRDGAGKSRILVACFVLALCIPIQVYLGDLRLSFYRIVLLLLIFPAAVRFLVDKDIRWRAADGLILFHCLWMAAALVSNGAGIDSAGISIIETAGAWLLARVYVRDLAGFVSMVRVLFLCVILSIPFAFYEAVTGVPIVLEMLDKIATVLPNVPHEQRFGLDRAQVVFDHPILYGMFCSLAFALSIYVLGGPRSGATRLLRGAGVGVATFLSLSSGALVCLAVQGALMSYDYLLRAVRARWIIMLSGALILYAALEIASSRTVPELLIPVLALNPGTAWTRLAVNDAAVIDIMAQPWLGYGLNAWSPSTPVPTASIDNFWLVIAFRSGVPGILSLVLAVLASVWTLARAKGVSPAGNACRTALCISILAFCVAVLTVHLWNASYCIFVFMLACGLWIADVPPTVDERSATGDGPSPAARPATMYSRFDGTSPPVRYRRPLHDQ
ncbi:hypothetical protein SAMN04515678_1175 [Roseivivax sediminis]|uniref:O-antigen ligase like membrane protein n=2 Tax=Roseivivax sediminis TaxID=936889 RepID=A0A1I2DHP5_9RHOB|nr:hypothetical protein SAMN04515678_1175 [Roseivivax sediminis]